MAGCMERRILILFIKRNLSFLGILYGVSKIVKFNSFFCYTYVIFDYYVMKTKLLHNSIFI